MSNGLERAILSDVGFEKDLDHYTGSPFCKYLRKHAVARLAAVIQKHHDRGSLIAPPSTYLIGVLARVVQKCDSGNDILTNTYHTITKVIHAHMEQADKPFDEQEQFFKQVGDELSDQTKREHLIAKAKEMAKQVKEKLKGMNQQYNV